MKKVNSWVVIIVVIIVALSFWFWRRDKVLTVPTPSVSSSQTPTSTATNQSFSDLIYVSRPQLNDLMDASKPIIIEGKARGSWYFEASFPVKLIDANGKVLAQSNIMANGDWMTTNFVPFTKELVFSVPTTTAGKLILEKDNPSGLPQNAAQLEIPIRFNITR